MMTRASRARNVDCSSRDFGLLQKVLEQALVHRSRSFQFAQSHGIFVIEPALPGRLPHRLFGRIQARLRQRIFAPDGLRPCAAFRRRCCARCPAFRPPRSPPPGGGYCSAPTDRPRAVRRPQASRASAAMTLDRRLEESGKESRRLLTRGDIGEKVNSRLLLGGIGACRDQLAVELRKLLVIERDGRAAARKPVLVAKLCHSFFRSREAAAAVRSGGRSANPRPAWPNSNRASSWLTT